MKSSVIKIGSNRVHTLYKGSDLIATAKRLRKGSKRKSAGWGVEVIDEGGNIKSVRLLVLETEGRKDNVGIYASEAL